MITIGEKVEGGRFKMDLTRLIETRMLAQANSGGGKSWLLRKFLEETHGKVQQIVLDVEGEFGTLREKFDYILAGKNADVAATPQTADLLARKVLELEADIIIDLYELKKHERLQFVQRFLDAMVNAPKELWHPCIVILDEAHIFAPEKGDSEALGAVIDMATRGRKRGFCLIPATQRLSKLHKDVAAECGNKLIGRTGLDIDMKRAAEELGFNSKAQMLSLRDLEPGQFFAFGPAISKEVVRVQAGAVQTRHPKAGQRLTERVPVPTGKVKALLVKLTDLPKQAEAERQDLESMRARVRTLEGELRTLRREGLSSKDAAELKEARITMQGLKNQKQRIIQAIDKLKAEIELLPETQGAPKAVAPATRPAPIAALAPRPHSPAPLAADTSGLGRCERAILKFLAARPDSGFNTSQIGALTGYSKKSSGFQNALSKLSVAGWIIREFGRIQISEDGRAHAMEVLGSEFEAPARSLDEWKGKLSQCPRRVFEQLVGEPARVFSKEEIAARTGYSLASSGFQNALSELSTLGLLQRTNGGVQLNPEIIGV